LKFAVFFLGDNELAQARAAQAVQCISGPYILDNGEMVLVEAKAHLLQTELATA
jgi:hypothetical protein